MDPITASLIVGGAGAAMSAGSSMYAADQQARSVGQTNAINAQLARETNAQNYKVFQESNAFTERMSSTARQRDVQDLKLAGLNPVLAAGGGGSSTPSSAPFTAQTPKHEAFSGNAEAARGVSAAVLQAASLAQTHANIALTKAQTSKTLGEAQVSNVKGVIADSFGDILSDVKTGWSGIRKGVGLGMDNAAKFFGPSDKVPGKPWIGFPKMSGGKSRMSDYYGSEFSTGGVQ